MPADANLIMLNVTDLDSGNDGNGSGSTETTAPGAVIDVPESADIAVVMFLSEPAATPAITAETLATIAQVSTDGGSTWGPIATFRTITASELKSSGVAMDESAGDPTFRRAIACRTPKADSDQSGLVKMRTNTVASSALDWAAYVAVVSRSDVRDVWYNDAQVA